MTSPQPQPALIAVGSTNPVKVNGTIQACTHVWPDINVQGFEVASGVSEQPRTDHETKTGAQNRAVAARAAGLKSLAGSKELVLGVGLEGGVFQDQDQLWSTVWASVTDGSGQFWDVNGARSKVPEPIAGLIQNGGEMGPAVSTLVSSPSIKQKEGMIGVITQGFIERTEEYSAIVKFALGLWYGQNWHHQL